MNPIYYNCRAKDKTIVDLSASGAISAIFAKAILDKGGIVYGAMYERNFKRVKMDWVDNIYDYYRFISKSKYVYSFMPKFSSIKAQLDSGKLVFVGALPCQIVALHTYLGKDYPNLYTSALKCHGGMKPKLYKEFVEKIEQENNSKVFSADFRKNHRYGFSVRFDNGVKKTYPVNTFLNNNMEQCGNCKVKFRNEFSDFIVGDYWEYQKNKETMFDPSPTVYDGVSYLRISTEKGLALFNEVKEQLDYKEFDNTKIKY